jgi:hypothetical protein
MSTIVLLGSTLFATNQLLQALHNALEIVDHLQRYIA